MGRSRGNFHHADEDPSQRFDFHSSISLLYNAIVIEFCMIWFLLNVYMNDND
jgi:hypothetical protein